MESPTNRTGLNSCFFLSLKYLLKGTGTFKPTEKSKRAANISNSKPNLSLMYPFLDGNIDLDVLFAEIWKLQNQHRFAVVFSGCVFTKSQIIIERIDIFISTPLLLFEAYNGNAHCIS
jgi:hypothetical protein